MKNNQNDIQRAMALMTEMEGAGKGVKVELKAGPCKPWLCTQPLYGVVVLGR